MPKKKKQGSNIRDKPRARTYIRTGAFFCMYGHQWWRRRADVDKVCGGNLTGERRVVAGAFVDEPELF